MDNMSDNDRRYFMDAVLNMGTVFDLPDNATRAEWNVASAAYNQMKANQVDLYGETITDKIDLYWSMPRETEMDRQRLQEWMNDHPEVQRALDYMDQQLLSDPVTTKYYMNYNKLARYYTNMQWDALEKEVGQETMSVMEEYWNLLDYGAEGEKKAFYRQNKRAISAYYDTKEKWRVYYDDLLAKIANTLPEKPLPQLQQLPNPDFGQQKVLGAVSEMAQPGLESVSWQEWSSPMPSSLKNLFIDYAIGGRELSYTSEKALESYAEDIGIDYDDLLRYMRGSLYRLPVQQTQP